MILQLISVSPSEYQEKYSPFITLFFTVTFLRVPERVLRVEFAVFEGSVLYVLEGIFSFQFYVPKGKIGRAHHKVFALGAGVPSSQSCLPTIRTPGI